MVKRSLIMSIVFLVFFSFSSIVGAEEKAEIHNEGLTEEQTPLLDENEIKVKSEKADSEEETASDNESLIEESANEETNEVQDEEINAEPVDEEMKEEITEKESTEEEGPNEETTGAILNTVQQYAPGDYGDHIVELKSKLVRLGFAKWSSPTPSYGQITSKVVAEFQAYYDLSPTGIADETTRAKIEEVLNPPYKIGDRGVQIVEIKENLVKLGYANWKNPSQFYGQITADTVKKFQSDYGLPIDGIAGTQTLNKIQTALIEGNEYRNGDSGQHVVALKQDLVKLGFASWKNPSQVYGNITANVVREFQSYYGLPATGQANETTRNKIAEVLNPPYKNRDRGEPVVKLKENLVKLGFANWSNPSQFYGTATANVVKKFQKENNLTVDGIAGSSTLAKIEELLTLESKYKNGDSGQHIVELKKDLVKLGFASWKSPSQVYGNITANVVREFQSYYGLPATGEANETTRNKIAEVLNPPYKNRDRGEPVVKLKENLVKLGFANWSNPSQFYGSVTANVVKEFQSYYGLNKTGVADSEVLSTIQHILTMAYQSGDSGPHIKKLKEGLTLLGFANWSDPTPVYGSVTARVVSEFQKHHNLKVSGLVDEVTLNKIEIEVEKKLESMQDSHYDITLEEALRMQMAANPQTDKYRNEPAYISSSYVNLGQKGTTNSSSNVNLRAKANTTATVNYTLRPNTTVVILGTVKGSTVNGSTEWYKVWYGGKENYVHSSLVNEHKVQMAIVTASNLNVRAKAAANSHKYGSFSKGTVLEVIGKKGTWLQVPYGAWRNATESDTLEYLDPLNKDIDEFQHLDLSSPVGAKAAELNKYLEGKGILAGKGQAFIDAAKSHNINELYLLSHALLETGNGTSKLSNGIVVNGKKVYNMFGIGAVDSCPEKCGSERAYKEGWDTPAKAIVGGAKFIGDKYIHNEYNQNTLYKMRWNPEGMARHGYATHQYATDIQWAKKQINNLKKLHREILANPVLKFNVVQYK